LRRGEEANWELAQLTFETTIDRGERRGDEKVTMDVWCRDVREVAGRRFSERTGRLYKRMWAEVGRQHVADLPSFADTLEQLAHPGGNAVERYTDWSAANVLNHGTPTQKVDTFRRLAEDVDVRADKQAQSAALEFGVQVYRQREQDVRAHWRADEASERQEQRLEAVGTALDLEAVCDQYFRAARAFEERIGPLLENERPADASLLRLRLIVQSTREALDRVEHWLEHGRSEVDAFVSSVLHPEGRP